MRLEDYRLLTDENIHSKLLAYLRYRGMEVWDVREAGWSGKSDSELLAFSVADRRVIVTPDSDFGLLAIRQGALVYGILYLRPGHIQADTTIGIVDSVFASEIEVEPPFVVVAQRKADDVTIRVRIL